MTDDNISSEDTDKKQSHLFQKGKSGNPAGRPKGSRSKHLAAAELLLDGEAETLTRKAIELAIAGDAGCLRLCMDRIIPPRKDRPLNIDMPKVTNLEEIAAAMGTIVQHVAEGIITPSEGAAMGALVQSYSDAIQLSDVARRLELLEQNAGLD